HGVGQRGTAFHRGANASEAFLEEQVLLVGGQNLQTLHQWKSSVNHDGELAEEDGNVLDGHFARAQLGQGKFFAFLLDGAGRDALTPQLHGYGSFAIAQPFPGNSFSLGIGPCECEYRHINDSSRARCLPTKGECTLFYRRKGAAVALAAITPRLIMSCNSSGMDERCSAVSSVICFWK